MKRNNLLTLSFLFLVASSLCAEEKSVTAVNNNILCPPTCTVAQMKKWAQNISTSTTTFINNADYVYSYAKQVGVNPCLVYAQYAYETGYGSYPGQVSVNNKNTCGLKNPNGTWAAFATWELGIEAHIDHLALYAGAPGYPRANSPDPKHFNYLLGCATTIDEMGLKWANGQIDYATRLKGFMQKIQETVANPTPTISVTPSSLSFSTTVGTSTSKTLTITGGQTTANITATSSSNLFTITPTTLPKTGGTITVTYTPTAAGTHTATITLKSSGASNKTVTLSGTATTPTTLLSFTEVWNYGETSGQTPTWAPTFGQIRNMDYANGKLYIVTDGTKISVINAQKGTYLGDLSNKNISGGGIALIDCKTVDGKVIASNVTTSTSSPLKVYIWDNDNAHPRIFLQTTNFGGLTRIGDCIGVQGNLTNGALYFAGADKVVRYAISNGVCATTPTIISMVNSSNNAITCGVSPRVIPEASGKWWMVSSTNYPMAFNANGTLSTTLNSATVGNISSGNAFKAFEFKDTNYGVATTYNGGTTTLTGGKVALIDATKGWAQAEKIADYPSNGLGSTRNTSFSTSVAVAVNGTSGVELWVLVHNQGVAYFKHGSVPTWNPKAPNPEEVTETVTPFYDNNLKISYNNETLSVEVENIDVAEIALYALNGQKISTAKNVNSLPIKNLQGFYIVVVKDKNNCFHSGKIAIK